MGYLGLLSRLLGSWWFWRKDLKRDRYLIHRVGTGYATPEEEAEARERGFHYVFEQRERPAHTKSDGAAPRN